MRLCGVTDEVKRLSNKVNQSVVARLNAIGVKQFLSYFAVGGVSAIVEWVVFYLLGKTFDMAYLPATALAFVISTATNWFLGRTFTFKGSTLGQKKAKEIILVFGVSAVGLLGNLTLMYVFVGILGMNTVFLKTVMKVLATGIIFIWNFLARKMWIYRDI